MVHIIWHIDLQADLINKINESLVPLDLNFVVKSQIKLDWIKIFLPFGNVFLLITVFKMVLDQFHENIDFSKALIPRKHWILESADFSKRPIPQKQRILENNDFKNGTNLKNDLLSENLA